MALLGLALIGINQCGHNIDYGPSKKFEDRLDGKIIKLVGDAWDSAKEYSSEKIDSIKEFFAEEEEPIVRTNLSREQKDEAYIHFVEGLRVVAEADKEGVSNRKHRKAHHIITEMVACHDAGDNKNVIKLVGNLMVEYGFQSPQERYIAMNGSQFVEKGVKFKDKFYPTDINIYKNAYLEDAKKIDIIDAYENGEVKLGFFAGNKINNLADSYNERAADLAEAIAEEGLNGAEVHRDYIKAEQAKAKLAGEILKHM